MYLLILFLTACQSNKQLKHTQHITPSNLYLDSYFSPATDIKIETEHEVFMLDADMISVVNENLRGNDDIEKRANALLEQIFSKNKIALNYASNANITAKEAFHSKEANCMSLTILAYALAKKAGFNVDFQQVEIPEYWVKNGQYSMLVGHINLLIKQNKNFKQTLIKNNKVLQIDFDPYISKEYFKKKVIDKSRVLAMYYNNKGVDALTSKDYVTAYQYFKAATAQDIDFSTAWGNLGVLYRFTDHNEMAEKVYRYTIDIDNKNLTTHSNLALLLRINKQDKKAIKIEKYILKQRVSNPFYHALLGDNAFRQKAYKESIHHYKKAIRLNSKRHEFYFGLAKSYFKLNDVTLAKKAIKKAIRFDNVNQQYVAKLNLYQSSKPD